MKGILNMLPTVEAQTARPQRPNMAHAVGAVRHDWTRGEVRAMFALPFPELMFQAQTVHRMNFDPREVQVSTLLSIKTGGCPEDCGYCPQSARYDTGLTASRLMEVADVLAEAQAAKAAGATRFCMGAAWRSPKDHDVEAVCAMIEGVKALGLESCATLGMLTPQQAIRLKGAGLDYYNHNLDTSAEFYGKIITTRTYADRLDTLANVRDAGINVCCGGIIGMGEGLEDRAGMITTLATLPAHPESVPINLLVQVKGTPLNGTLRLDPLDFVRTIAVARITMPRSMVRLSAGREDMSDEVQALCFLAGANSIFYGDRLLTTPNPGEDHDRALFDRLGLVTMPPREGADWQAAGVSGKRASVTPASNEPDWYESGSPHIWLPYTQMKTAPPPLAVARTHGSRIVLADGRELVDGIASWWTACHGYNHPHIRAAVARQLEIMPHVMLGGLAHEAALTLASRLAGLLPGDLSRVFFCDSGSVAVEVALKMATQYWLNQGVRSRSTFVAFKGGYHGDTIAAMAVSDPDESMHALFKGLLPRHHVIDLPQDDASIAAFDQFLAEKADILAGMVVEPLVQGAGGMLFHNAAVLRCLRAAADRYGLVLICDEIFTGFGRTGAMFACEAAGIVPDIMTLSKALTGGTMTLAATVARGKIFDAFWSEDPAHALMHGPTYMANALACAAANASLDLFEREPRLAQIAAISKTLGQDLEVCRGLPGVKDVRVQGAIGVVEMNHIGDLNGLKRRFVDAGVWVRPFNNIIYLTPAFTIDAEDLAKLTRTIFEVLKLS
ncbi:MAG: adenosylmethionine--8-amino-7-oxononanoate transaminase [Rhodospirillaceae bacterium]|nr:adenosylmethionine--8-amino-7-oxononanoate transaminase [Rhodospirillaceae bacterium]